MPRALSALVCVVLALAVVVPRLPAAAQAAPPAAGLQLFVEPEAGVAPFLAFIGVARHTLDGEIYILTSSQITGALGQAVQRGVQVRILLEPHLYGGPADAATTAYRALSAAGVQVRWSPPGFRFTHAKFLVADRAQAWSGTMNWSPTSFTSNREFGVEDANPAEVKSSEDVFQEELVDQASIQALLGASRRGVRVRVVYTGVGNLAALAAGLTLKVSWQAHHH